ncbi:Arylsulfotransferase (ASST) [Roseivivax lentus]|uniref:Arylsulfotransferase (ASST) n=1 Tax=Roseivivax lentus TaxID=633194 RepID=A0A1N7N9K4_9RHOB|nr:arylsulfotransferase family protein [Roseivivax lentus]SIS94938.1 Arylsulfotransferase (ASST) [Roseivivax lentus]
MWIERLLFRKVELWAVALLLVLAALLVIGLAAVVYDTTKGKARFGALGTASVHLARAPWTFEEMRNEDTRTLALEPGRFDGPGGWWIEDGEVGADIPGYVLVSRHDGDAGRHVIEMYDLSDFSLVHRWWPDAETLLADARRDWAWMDYTGWRRSAWRAIHPLLLENGDLIVKDHYSPLLRVSACGDRVWLKDDVYYHHSTEPDGAGGFWIPTAAAPSDLPGVEEWFIDDTLTRMSHDGTVTFARSLPEIFIENGLRHRIFAAGLHANDPLHLNDIEPVLADGPFWRKGDLFLSLRRYSMIVLYRPGTDEIVWMQEGPWMDQHDVDVIDDHTIAVFNNNTANTGRGARVEGISEVLFHDFETGQTTSPFRETLETYAVRTPTEGLFDILPSGHLLLEEENAGRLLLFSPEGAFVAAFVNNDAARAAHRMGWSRYVPEELGQRALPALDCSSR